MPYDPLLSNPFSINSGVDRVDDFVSESVGVISSLYAQTNHEEGPSQIL